MAVTVQEIGDILRLIEASSFEEVVVELEGARVTARRPAASPATQPSLATGSVAAGQERPSPASGQRRSAMPLPRAAVATPAAAFPAPLPPVPAPMPPLRRPAAQATVTLPQGLVAIRAPLVGTFFLRPAPDQPVFVEPGQAVKRGQPLCLIEVMKLYTMLEAPADGIIEAILADDGALVEYDQPLFAIRIAS